MELNALTECHIKKYKNLALNLPFSSQYNITAVPARCVQTKEKHAEKREDKGKHDELKSKLNLNFSFGWPSDCIINATMSWANVTNWEIGNSWSDIPFKIFNYSPAVDLNSGWYKLSQKLESSFKISTENSLWSIIHFYAMTAQNWHFNVCERTLFRYFME